ncbi:MAG: LamG domain-containing protein [Candidatus Marinimicrobia bacterium]|nr:LamG domain-containing protein [Candidatus Neomarinimicrobiota bacterium]
MRVLRRRLVWILWLACGGGLGAAWASGTLTYPAEDNFAMNEGTIEFWVQTPVDLQAEISAGPYKGLLTIMEVRGAAGGFNLFAYTGASYSNRVGLWISVGSVKAQLHPFGLGEFLPAPGEWQHLALTWQGREMTFYLNGQPRAGKTFMESLDVALGIIGEAPLVFGDPRGATGRFVVDELRVSSVARTADELGFHGPLAVDPFTRILDRFEDDFVPDGQWRTAPEVIFAGAGGRPSRGCQFTAGRYARGLALYRIQADQ